MFRSLTRLVPTAFLLGAVAHAQCWTQALWDAHAGLPSATNGGFTFPTSSSTTPSFPAPGVMQITSPMSGAAPGYGSVNHPSTPQQAYVEAELRVVSGSSTHPTIGLAMIALCLGPHYNVRMSLFEDHVVLVFPGTLTVLGSAPVDGTVFGVYRLEADGATGAARLYRDGLLLLSVTTQGNNAAATVRLDGGTPFFAPGCVSEWKWLRHNLSSVDDLGTYCVAKPNSWGCTPQMGYAGRPEWSAGGFDIQCSEVPAGIYGILGWSVDRNAAVPFAGGTRCIGGTAIYRSPVVAALPHAGSCAGGGGRLSYRFSDLYGQHPALSTGTTVFAQWFYRDPASQGWGLSEGLKFTICP